MKSENSETVEIHGLNVDPKTRCGHYRGEIDIIAIKFKCCGKWFPCYECHAAISDHPAEVWSQYEYDEKAIFCGNCRHQLTINEYFNCSSACPNCSHQFNPKCVNHYHLYFETVAKNRESLSG